MAALSQLISRRDAGEIDFDRVVIETTGVANPGPVAQTFFMDEEIAQRYLLDAVVTLVDAKHAEQQLDKQEEAQRRVGFADAIFITKADPVGEPEVAELRHRLLHMNPRAPIRTAHFGEAPIDAIFDLRGFNLNAKLEIDPDFLRADDEHDHNHGHDHEHGEQCGADCGHDHGHDAHGDHGHGHAHDHHHHHHHTDRIASFVFRSEQPFHYGKLEEFLSGILSVYGEKLLRYKGVLYMQNVDRKVVFRGVHQLMGSDVGAKWGDETRHQDGVHRRRPAQGRHPEGPANCPPERRPAGPAPHAPFRVGFGVWIGKDRQNRPVFPVSRKNLFKYNRSDLVRAAWQFATRVRQDGVRRRYEVGRQARSQCFVRRPPDSARAPASVIPDRREREVSHVSHNKTKESRSKTASVAAETIEAPSRKAASGSRSDTARAAASGSKGGTRSSKTAASQSETSTPRKQPDTAPERSPARRSHQQENQQQP